MALLVVFVNCFIFFLLSAVYDGLLVYCMFVWSVVELRTFTLDLPVVK